MKVLKGFALGLLSFILFVFLVVFGVALTVNQVALNPHFITKIVNAIDYSKVVDEIASQTEFGEKPLPPEAIKVLKDTFTSTQPLIKQQLTVAIEDTYSYALGKPDAPNLKTTLGKTFMNTDFTAKFLANVVLSDVLQQMANSQTNAQTAQEKAFQQAIIITFNQMEPSIKQQMVDASDPIYKYLLGQTSSIDLRTIMRNTFLSRDFIIQVVDNVDMPTLTRDTLRNQIAQLPGGIQLSSAQLDQIVNTLTPSLKNGFKASADQIGDYLVGARPDFSVSVQLSPVMPQIKPIVKQAYLDQLPPDLRGASQTQIDQAFELYWMQSQSTFPASFPVDSKSLGMGLSSQMNDTFTSAQRGLADARKGIDEANRNMQDRLSPIRNITGYFRLGFVLLIILMLLIIGGIILVHRSIRGACRDLGITFLSYGAIEFVGLLIIRNILPNTLPWGSERMPEVVSSLIPTVVNGVTDPLFIFSLVCLLGGIGLIVVSILYPKKETVPTDHVI